MYPLRLIAKASAGCRRCKTEGETVASIKVGSSCICRKGDGLSDHCNLEARKAKWELSVGISVTDFSIKLANEDGQFHVLETQICKNRSRHF